MYKFPTRKQFDKKAFNVVKEVFQYYNSLGKDFGCNGIYKKKYCSEIANFIDPNKDGYVEVVCSGTVAIYVALKALSLKKNSHVLVSPITDPGMITPIIMLGLKPKILDINLIDNQITLDEIIKRHSSKVSAIILNHFAGNGILEIKKICSWAKKNNIRLIEDFSQAQGAKIQNHKVGSFGDISCMSTMFSKNHSTGGAGGVIYTKNKNYYKKIILHSQKGKPFFEKHFSEKNPNLFKTPALNFGINEISHALGSYTLKKLEYVNKKRCKFLIMLSRMMKDKKLKTELLPMTNESAPFFAVFIFNKSLFKCSKIHFAKALVKNGITLNTHYEYQVYEWPWLKKYLADKYVPVNSLWFKNNTFNLLFNENFNKKDAKYIVDSIAAVEKKFLV